MRKLTDKLQILITAVLTLALLLGPCLSIAGFSGSGQAHAHGHHGGQTKETGHQHVASGGAEDTQSPAPDKTSLSCEELCEGWAIKKMHRDVAVAIVPMPQGPVDQFGLENVSPLVDGWGRHRHRNLLQRRSSRVEAVAIYSLTSRYRL